jgi:hypothetical protein
VSDPQRLEAEERINRYAPKELPVQVATAEKGQANNKQQVEIKEVKEEGDIPPECKKNQVQEIKLTDNEKKLLRVISEKIMPITQAYRKAGLTSNPGNITKNRLKALGLIQEESILFKPGRGGKATVIVPSLKAIEILPIKPSKGTRGGDSIQHRYLCPRTHRTHSRGSERVFYRPQECRCVHKIQPREA